MGSVDGYFNVAWYSCGSSYNLQSVHGSGGSDVYGEGYVEMDIYTI
jgi:hypothetical protein